jgi:uracil phosphoribosyltransferase
MASATVPGSTGGAAQPDASVPRRGGIHLVKHPLVEHHVTRMRRESTRPSEFRGLVRRLATLMAYEATQDLPTQPYQVTTPICEAEGVQIKGRIGIVPILRAGLGMVDPVLDLLPMAEVWHLGLYRDEATAQPVSYYDKLPAKRPVDVAMVLDPMLATGGSLEHCVRLIAERGCTDITVICVLAAPEGVARLESSGLPIRLVTAAIDEQLNDRAFIVPGLGDAGDRQFGPPA